MLTAQQGTSKLLDLLSEVNLRLLRVPWIARRSNQSILKESSPEYSLEGRTDAKGEAPILWPPDAKSGLVGKDDAGKD